ARMIIEPAITAAAAAHRTMEDIAEMRKDIELMTNFSGTAEEFANLDMMFHIHIARASHNDLITLILKPIYKLMPRLKTKIVDQVSDATVAAIVWHKKIFEAIEAGDEKAALETMQEHLKIAKQHALLVTGPN
ncbi:MAG: FadR family transcriptional regulator, partial [Ignavibacteriales bacterium]|nr:FadR family transcriptional regulator [Ignavibacteriales bacterium]